MTKFDRNYAPFTTYRVDAKGYAIKDEPITIDIGADLKIGRDLQRALRENARLLGWYSQLKEHAHIGMKQAAYRAKCREEDVYEQIRDDNTRMSETQVKNKVHRDPKWRKLTERYMTWRNRFRMLDDICRIMHARNQDLRTLESSERSERENA